MCLAPSLYPIGITNLLDFVHRVGNVKKVASAFHQFLPIKRLEQAIPGSDGSYASLSLGRALNVLFLLKGEWGSIGDYWTTYQAVRALVGDDLLWAEPQKSSPAPVELIQ